MKYRNRELMIDKSVNKKCLERVQGLLSEFPVSDVVNAINHLNNDSRWLDQHIAVHTQLTLKLIPHKIDPVDDLLGPFGRAR